MWLVLATAAAAAAQGAAATTDAAEAAAATGAAADVLVVVPPPSAAPLHVGNETHLLLDAELVGHCSGLSLVAHRPSQASSTEQPLAIVAEHPWEHRLAGYASVVQAGAADFRIYYDAMGPTWRVFCVATSSDGKRWSKPSLGLHNFNGSTANNIVMGGTGSNVAGGNVFLDSNPAAKPSERFKMSARVHNSTPLMKPNSLCPDPSCKLRSGTHIWASADGFNFSHVSGPHIPYSDTQSVIFWQPKLSKYLVYFRTHQLRPDHAPCPAGKHAERSIGRMAVADLAQPNWGLGDQKESNHSTVFNVDDADPPCLDVYTSAATLVAGHVFIFPMMFLHCSTDLAKADRFRCSSLAHGRLRTAVSNGLLEAHMAVAKGPQGDRFHRISHDAYLPRGRGQRRPPNAVFAAHPDFSGAFNSGSTAVAAGLITVEDEHWQFGFGSQSTHGTALGLRSLAIPGDDQDALDPPHLSGIQKLVIRKHGFVSLRSNGSMAPLSSSGRLQTVPLVLPKCNWTLILNVQTAISGGVAVRLLEAESHADNRWTAGRVLAQGHDIVGNSVAWSVGWSKGSDLHHHKPTILEMNARGNVDLYSFQFAC
jgi:hypothetical protein